MDATIGKTPLKKGGSSPGGALREMKGWQSGRDTVSFVVVVPIFFTLNIVEAKTFTVK